MRKIDWEGPLSDDDIVWLRQAGFVSDEQIIQHQSQFEADVPDLDVPDDEGTRSVLDPTARLGEPVPAGNGAPVLIDPTKVDPQEEDVEEDDYDTWYVTDLEKEVSARNALPETSTVEVTGTGKDGKILKADLIKGLRLWDAENPGALKD